VVPRFLALLGEFGWRITTFVVGQDAVLERNRDALRLIADREHEIGNHSFNHEPWLHLYTRRQVEYEIDRTDEVIEAVTGVRPQGFRGPGYSFSRTTLEVLRDRGYRYDASTMPTYLGPLARAYYFMTSDFTDEEKEKRKALFGGLGNGLRPVHSYLWDLGEHELLEIPVTTIPVLKLPFHFSYLLYLGTFSTALAVVYFRVALAVCRATGTEPSLLLHPLDFLGCDDVSELAFFPAMKKEGATKLELLARCFRVLQSHYDVLPMGAHADRIRLLHQLRHRSPD
jgi:hypothetical protein